MNDNQSALADFFADRDIDSLRVLGLESHGIDLSGVYCLHTGRRVGTFDDFVIQFAIFEETADDDESLVDALVSRCIASMRPTPMLNRPDRLTLTNLAAKFPVDILSFLVNRIHSNRWLATHRPSDILDPYIMRIKMHERWDDLARKGVDTRPWIHWLLELDAKRNLHDLTPPTGEFDRLGKWIETKTGESLFSQATVENSAELLKAFEKWAFDRLVEFDRRDREAKSQEHWMRGNTMSHNAYVRSWLENPEVANRKRAEELKRDAKKSRAKIDGPAAKPKSEKQQKQDARIQAFLGLLDQVLDGDIAAAPKKQVAKPITIGDLFRKKES